MSNSFPLFQETSYEPAPKNLPDLVTSKSTETVLLTVHLSSPGRIVEHRGAHNKSVDSSKNKKKILFKMLNKEKVDSSKSSPDTNN